MRNKKQEILFYSTMIVCIWTCIGWILTSCVSVFLGGSSGDSILLVNQGYSIIWIIIFTFFALNIRQKKRLLFPILFAIVVDIIAAIFPDLFQIRIVTMFGQTSISIIPIFFNILIPCAMGVFYSAFFRHPTSCVRIGAIFAIISCVFQIATKLSYFSFLINTNIGEQIMGISSLLLILCNVFLIIFWVMLTKELYVNKNM